MKKIFFSLVALAALAACSKSEIAYEQTGEIAFSPVAKTVTKSVAGLNSNGTFDGIFPTEIKLYVFANAEDQNADGTLAGTWNTPYFANAEFAWTTAKNESEIDNIAAGGAYAGNPERYWPNVKTLKFAGYSDACGVSKTAPTMNFTDNVLTIPSYTQNNLVYDEEGENDLMWFPSDGQAYTRQENEVVAQMKHACSWITVNVKAEGAAIGWTLNSLVVENIAHTGKAECGATAATWNSLSDYKSEDYFNAQTTNTFDPEAGETLTADSEEYYDVEANNFIVIPQTPTKLYVTYSYLSDPANDTWFTEIKPIELDYDGVANANAAWQSGVHYIYNLTITATEILIDPVVVEWTPNTPTIPEI